MSGRNVLGRAMWQRPIMAPKYIYKSMKHLATCATQAQKASMFPAHLVTPSITDVIEAKPVVA